MNIEYDEQRRKFAYVMVPKEWGERDAGKTFLLNEWASDVAENWAWRALIAYSGGGGGLPPEAAAQGMRSIFWLGVDTFLRGKMTPEFIPIIEELLTCVTIVRDASKRNTETGKVEAYPLLQNDIHEVKTRLWLRSEVLRLHTNFSPADLLFGLVSRASEESTSTSTKSA